MPSITKLLSRLKSDFPQYIFESGKDFIWSPSKNTIYYNKQNKDGSVFLLHELSHALLDHVNYESDVLLIAMERQAWEETKRLSLIYKVFITDEIIQSNLDSYRDWLHYRSLCPNCNSVGIEISKCFFKCIACSHKWKTNEARTCYLKRYDISK